MKRNKSILTIALTSFTIMVPGVEAFAQTTTSPSQTQQSTTAGSTYIVPTGGGNAADSGRNSASTDLVSAAVNVGAAGMYMGVCVKPYCAGCWACPLVGMAAVAASMLGEASGGSAGAGASMSAYDPATMQYGVQGGVDQYGNPISYGDGTNGANGAHGGINAENNGGAKLPDGTTPQTIANAVAKIRSELEKSGVSISADGKTMTTKDGRKFDLSKGADGSPQGLQAMGLTAAEAGQASEMGKKYGAQAQAKYAGMIAKMGAEGGGGGGSAGRGPASDGAGGGGMNGWNPNDPFGKNRAKPKISGLTKKLGDDTIGVSGDDIFEMITRRYKARDQVNQFLKD